MKNQKERLDILLVENGLFETREKAKRAVMAGLVFANETRLEKPGEKIDRDTLLTVKGKKLPYVSRGGLKLEKALKVFHVDIQDKVLLDIGASTGGFTDCALQNGAKLSYALDVGYNQLAWKLRQDDRVVVMERTNFRYVTPNDLVREKPNFASIDVSFISLKLILPVLITLLEQGSDIIALIKPQFEAGRDQVGKKGIVRDPKTHEQVINTILSFALELGLDVKNLSYSPITGGDGNIEFLAHFFWEKDKETGQNFLSTTNSQIVAEAHAELKTKQSKSEE
ncbi:TlyA family RNA methyltransferase [Bacillus sp. 03113]|uniref:TlyA family RNA methyltransferase n=1 Tax=Bacillus sp. 03113 TaxID=2578211 RepID=UPI001143E05B|nr:TlyA family RNA methyltransferase [Bacillus sp. 03113]